MLKHLSFPTAVKSKQNLWSTGEWQAFSNFRGEQFWKFGILSNLICDFSEGRLFAQNEAIAMNRILKSFQTVFEEFILLWDFLGTNFMIGFWEVWVQEEKKHTQKHCIFAFHIKTNFFSVQKTLFSPDYQLCLIFTLILGLWWKELKTFFLFQFPINPRSVHKNLFWGTFGNSNSSNHWSTHKKPHHIFFKYPIALAVILWLLPSFTTPSTLYRIKHSSWYLFRSTRCKMGSNHELLCFHTLFLIK